jgi:hypothetical protein
MVIITNMLCGKTNYTKKTVVEEPVSKQSLGKPNERWKVIINVF